MFAVLSWGGLMIPIARAISVTLSVFTAYRLNRAYTFATSGPPSFSEFLRYATAMSLGIGVNYSVFLAAVYLSQTIRDTPLIGLVISTLAAMSLNFLSARFLLNR